jgi:hypothetical protein
VLAAAVLSAPVLTAAVPAMLFAGHARDAAMFVAHASPPSRSLRVSSSTTPKKKN